MTLSARTAAALGITAALALGSRPLRAQVTPGYIDLGPVVGIGASRRATMSAGFRYEMILRQLRGAGEGLLGYASGADIYRYTLATRPLASTAYVIPISMLGTYHPRIDPTRKVDLFLGAGIGFDVVRCKLKAIDAKATCPVERAYLAGRVGGRYFIHRSVALYGDASTVGSAINLGITFTDRPDVVQR